MWSLSCPFGSADTVGGHRAQQQRLRGDPLGGGGGGDDDAGARVALDQAGDLLEVVAADPRDVAVYDARPGAAAELDPVRGGDLVRRGGVVGAQQVQPERGPVR